MSHSGFLDVSELKIESSEGVLPPPAPTPLLYDRRAADRREFGRVPEPLERKASRRGEERRASPRVPRRLWVVDTVEGGVPTVYEGEVGLGGASWFASYVPLSEQIEVRFRVPEYREEVRARAKIARIKEINGDTYVQVIFTDLPLRDELALARYLDDCVVSG